MHKILASPSLRMYSLVMPQILHQTIIENRFRFPPVIVVQLTI